MQYKTPSHLARHEVKPGERFASASPALISTLLGSCVAACLFDPESRVAGMNHFLLAAPRYAKSLPLSHTEAGRYGIDAMELLIDDMIRMGAVRQRLKAKVFGGAAVLGSAFDNFFCVHQVNQRFIREYLATESIPILSEDLGGLRGRIVHFQTDTFKVMRRYIKGSSQGRIGSEEHGFWKSRAERAVQAEGGITLFA